MLTYSGKALTERIANFKMTNAERRAELHSIACSAVRLAARAGRANWLNLVYDALDELERNAFQSWFATANIKTPVWGEKDAAPWVTFDRKDGFTVVPGTEKLRPSDKQILAIEADLSKSFVHKSARDVSRDNGWNGPLIAAAKNFERALKKAQEKAGNVIPQYMLNEVENLSKDIQTKFSNEKLGIQKPLPAGALTDEQIEELASKMDVGDIPEPHVVDAEKPAEARKAGGRRAAH